MSTSNETLFIQHFGNEESRTLNYYLNQMNGYTALKKALGMKPDQLIEEVKASNLRGRGGAGFPTGVKWGFIPKQSDRPKYVVINADESEPGTFKDRDIMRYTPFLLLEGMVITGHAIGSNVGYIYIRGEYTREAKLLNEAIQTAYDRGYLGKNIQGTGFDFDVTVHRGAGAYICGEETALLNSLEGKRGEPRVKPPFPAIEGAFRGPTVVNNVETIANLPFIVNRGGKWFSDLGNLPGSGGTRLVGVSGHVKKPGLYEFGAGGVTIRELIYDYCGGILGDKKLKAVIPGGSSSPVLRADEIDVILDIEPLQKIGSMLGTASVMVVSEDYNVVQLLRRMIHFYAHESCGQCTPCREGSQWMEDIVKKILRGQGREEDIDLLEDIASNIDGKTLCALGEAVAWPVQSFVKKFRPDFEAFIRGGAHA
ncbi:MAG: NADH-quinone oxidoreductase subunit F [Bdellovibrionaceae bacterium]|nr:NADH-quinone oxidoreductase subunit F [Pseudobdellovibrionaceae bacterium]|tara:strand:- start:2351 stop:3625 length:1275 start_codon:yes stop_codon:yes gene_type:complete